MIPAVRVQSLAVRRDHGVILRYPDLQLSPQSVMAITGPSGTGKTTLLHVLAGLLVPMTGTVQCGTVNLTQASAAQRDRYRREGVGYVFQDFHLMPGLSALENVELGARVAGVRQPGMRAREALKQLDLGNRLGHAPAQLSTGERQRVAIARAVVHQPSLLLVDEPTAHLDRARAQIAMTLLTEAARSFGATLIVVTHDPLVADALPQRLILDAGVAA